MHGMNKPVFLIILAILISAGVSGYIGWKIGFAQGVKQALGVQRGTMVGGHGVLEDLRAGNLARGIERTESMMFSAATGLLDHPHWRRNSTVQIFADRIALYRAEHRSNPDEWGATERRLEELLQERNRQGSDE